MKKAKIILIKSKKEYIEELDREVTVVKHRQYFVTDLTKDLQTDYGTIKKSDLKKTGTIQTDRKKEFRIFDAGFIDNYRRIKRLPQIIPLKDIGFILAQTGVGSESIVVEAGTGSGALGIFLARHVKKVISYDINDEHLKVAEKNIEELGIKNMELKKGDITKKIDEKDVDLISLDMPDPWNALGIAEKALKQGGFLVAYCPMMSQSTDLVNAVLKKNGLWHIKTVELTEQEWEIEQRKVRPKSKSTIHSGFLSFCRKV